ncbi:MAG: RND transporter, partial [Methylotenera sp.]|nr:RND transporter [Methylotenera sp.]
MRLHSNFYTTKRIALVSVILLFAGCKSLGPDYQRPAMAIPTQFSEEVADNKITSSIANTWWTLYQDKTLNDLVAMAQQNNTDIKLAVARIEEA